jgi:hypothetical protein
MEKTKFLSALLDCGTADVDFLINQFEKFEVDYDDVMPFVRGSWNDMDYDTILSAIYRKAVYNAIDNNPLSEYHDDIWDDVAEVDLNYCASHLYMKSKDGETLTMYDYDDIVNFLTEYFNEE